MANIKISQLTSLSTMTDAAVIPVVAAGVTQQISGTNLKTYFGNSTTWALLNDKTGAAGPTIIALGQNAGLVRPKAIGPSTQQLQNANRDETLKLGRDAGYVALPTDVGGTKTGRFLEGVSGKFKTEELASARNQQVTNNLTKRYLDLPEDTPLTSEVLENARTSVYPAYEAIKETGTISFGNKNPFSNIVTGVNKVTGGKNALMQDIPDTYSMDAATAIQRLKELRSDGSAYLRSGTNIMKPNPKEVARGNRYLAEADKLEKAIENHVIKLGQPELINQFRDARKYIAKTFTVEEFQADFDNLIQRVENGESFIITDGERNAVIVPYNETIKFAVESKVDADVIRIHTDHEEGS